MELLRSVRSASTIGWAMTASASVWLTWPSSIIRCRV